MLTEGLLDRDASGRWLLGPELYLLGVAAAPRYDVTSVAQPLVRGLAIKTGESAFFSARRGDETICLLREDGSFPVRSHVLYEGIRFPLGVASAGLAVLAHLSDPEIRDYLSRVDLVASYGSAHAPELMQMYIEETRRLGYSVNPGLIVEGSWGMGAAVFDSKDRPQWALSLTGIQLRFSEPRRREMGSLLLRAAHDLSQAIRARPTPTAQQSTSHIIPRPRRDGRTPTSHLQLHTRR